MSMSMYLSVVCIKIKKSLVKMSATYIFFYLLTVIVFAF